MIKVATQKVSIIVVILTIAIILGTGGMANLGTSSAQGQLQGMKFTAQLSGKDESPSVDSTATGTAQLQLSPDGKELTYDLTTKDLKAL